MQTYLSDEFRDRGYLDPMVLMSPDDMTNATSLMQSLICDERTDEDIYSAVTPRGGNLSPIEAIYDAHLRNDIVRSIAANQEIVLKASEALGSGLCIWRTTFWIKRPGARRLEWHQDTYKDEKLGSFPNINAWVSFTGAVEENCVWLLPGSHTNIIDLSSFQAESYLAELTSRDDLPPPPIGDRRLIKKMAMKAGEFFLFDGRILHGSPPNRTIDDRIGFVVRFVPSDYRFSRIEPNYMRVS